MSRVLVAGLTNIETTLKIEGFPIAYNPVNFPFFGVASTVSGVGINLAKAFTALGDKVDLLTLLGNDMQANAVYEELTKCGVSTEHVLKASIKETPQSVILYDPTGRRQIYTDLKDIQEAVYPAQVYNEALDKCDIAAICNINFSRPLLKAAKEKGKLIATDVHVLKDIHDAYNSDYMRHANILFMSNEGISEPYEDFAKELLAEYDNDILVIGLGSQGALLYVKKDNFMGRFKAVQTRQIINTIGAGDSLFTSFVHYYAKTGDPYESIKRAIVFASWKIGEKGAAQGFLSETQLEELYQTVKHKI
ncbi:MAG: carbohydrate kinase family protein [Clostridia bacterium]|nr:carbohydrate kinase family protein [Clostridia bacterium]